jgi:hypothetical protein
MIAIGGWGKLLNLNLSILTPISAVGTKDFVKVEITRFLLELITSQIVKISLLLHTSKNGWFPKFNLLLYKFCNSVFS